MIDLQAFGDQQSEQQGLRAGERGSSLQSKRQLQSTSCMILSRMSATFLVETFLLLVHLCGVSTNSNRKEKLNALDDILSGPASRKEMILHHDPALNIETLQAIKELQGVKNVPHISLASGHRCITHSEEKDNRFQLIGRTSNTIHIFLFIDYKPKLMKDLCSCWTPQNLLLYSLAPVNATTVLQAEALVQVKKVALITEKVSERKYQIPLFAVYTLLPYFSRVPVFLGEWNPQKFTTLQTFLIDRYPNFEGYKFEIASWVGEMPFIYRRGSDQPIEGVSIEMLHCLAAVLNFTFTLMEEPPDLRIGRRTNGSWDGLFGMVYRVEKDFTINNIYLLGERTVFFAASVPCWQDGYGVFLRQPETLPKWVRVYRTFTPLVWALVFIFLAITTLFLYVQVSNEHFTLVHFQKKVFLNITFLAPIVFLSLHCGSCLNLSSLNIIT